MQKRKPDPVTDRVFLFAACRLPAGSGVLMVAPPEAAFLRQAGTPERG
jgi:hypothetical protein